MYKIIEKYKIKAKKSLWQNFLIDENILENISTSTNISWENIIEVWPWFWVLTQKILERNPLSLTLVELDKDMIEILNDRIKNDELKTKNTNNFQIINEDILKTNFEFQDYKVIANIPYYITSPIIFKFAYESENIPKEMLILMQKEVGDRIVWKYWKKMKSSYLSLFVQKKYTIEEKIFVSSKCFFPPPKVDSSVIFFQKHDKFNHIDDLTFLDFIKKSFSNPRKKLISNLINYWYNKDDILEKMQKLWYWENVRPEELKIEDYISIIS